MKTVYRTTNLTDAQVVASLLERNDVSAAVLDQNQGPYAHALGSVRVAVAPDREADARKLIAEWEARRAPDEKPVASGRMPSRDTLVLALGIVALLAVVWYFGGR